MKTLEYLVNKMLAVHTIYRACGPHAHKKISTQSPDAK